MKKLLALAVLSLLTSCSGKALIMVQINPNIEDLYELTSLELERKLLARDDMVLLVFQSSCLACHTVLSTLKNYVKETNQLLFKVPMESFILIDSKLLSTSVKSTPTLIFYSKGEAIDQKTNNLTNPSYLIDLITSRIQTNK